ncbi:siderophore-interacting protein [Glutamicibacter sp. X7]
MISIEPLAERYLRVYFRLENSQRLSLGFDDVVILAFGTDLQSGNIAPHPPEGASDKRYALREYTVRDYREDSGLLCVDFLIHSHGAAIDWVRGARPGACLWVLPPRLSRHWPEASTTVLLADACAWPAVARFCVEARARGTGFEALVAAAVPESPGVRSLPGVTPEELVETSSELHRSTAAQSFVWIAGEAAWMRELRQLILSRTPVLKEHIQFTGYWRTENVSLSREKSAESSTLQVEASRH